MGKIKKHKSVPSGKAVVNKDVIKKNKLSKIKTTKNTKIAPKHTKVSSKNSVDQKTKSKDSFKSMSVDDFLSQDFEQSDSEEFEIDNEDTLSKELEGNADVFGDDHDAEDDEEDAEDVEVNENSNDEDEVEEHKKSLAKLKETDPEFYKFLQENDKKLLDFNLPDEKDEESDEEQVHRPVDSLDVASDESDFEDGEEGEISEKNKVITLKMLKTWQSQIKTDKSSKTINTLVQAFHAALLRVSAPEKIEEVEFKVDGSAVFNAVIQLCVLELGPAIKKFLGLNEGKKEAPHKCKKFVKVKRTLKDYFTDLLKLLTGVTSPNIQTVLLKHLHYMSPFLISYPNVSKLLVKKLITIWGTADEGVRVIAFFCILRITNNQQPQLLETTLKSMYMTYVKNSKFVSVGSIASINFMRRSLVEMFALDLNLAYQQVFLYIRQLAIHLRNAITINKKENVQAVYNWQFVNSIKLWANLLASTCNKPQLQQLLYPLVQVCLGTIKLVPTQQYYPLRFHLVQVLMDLSRDTDVFIPVIPFLLEVLHNYDFNKKHQKVSMKPLNFTFLLRLSKSQLSENGFKDAVIDTIYEQLLEYLTNQSHNIAFPDLSLICAIQLKQFIKKCKNVKYNRKMKQILEKIEQNSQFIEKERKSVTFNLTDLKQIEGWEAQIKVKGTPFGTFYESWNKVRSIKKKKQLTNNEEMGDYKLPTLKRRKATEVKKSEGPVELFPSDSEDEESEGQPKRTRGKRGGKNAPKKIVDHSGPVQDTGGKDIVEDINISDW